MSSVCAPTMVDFLRRLGAALCLAGESASRVPERLDRIARAHGVRGADFFVVPTGVFVRVEGEHGPVVDFAMVRGPMLRLDQISAVYELLEAAQAAELSPGDGLRRLEKILVAPPRFGPKVTVLGHVVLTIGLGLLLGGEEWRGIAGWAVLGALVGGLRWIANRSVGFSYVLPIAASVLVTVLVVRFGALLPGVRPASLILPPLVMFLPGAALALGAIEMATGSTIGGATRLVSAIYALLLIAFGILVGLRLVGPATFSPTIPPLSGFTPWIGVVVFGLGLYWYLSARSLPWLLLALAAARGAMVLGSLVSGLFGVFVGGLVIVPVAWAIERAGGPPAQASFLPAFWILVPGSVGLSGLTGVVGAAPVDGTRQLLTVLLAVTAIVLGVLVGSGITYSVSRRRSSGSSVAPSWWTPS